MYCGIYMRIYTIMHESWHMNRHAITRICKRCVTHGAGILLLEECGMSHKGKKKISHIGMGRVAYEWVVSHTYVMQLCDTHTSCVTHVHRAVL